MEQPVPRFCPRCVIPIETERCPRCQESGVSSTGTPRADLVGEVLDGRYEVVRLIKRGGMGAVYEAVDQRLGRTVALKVLQPDAEEGILWHKRFQREAKLTALLSHPNCIRLYDFGCAADDLPYLVMELLTGQDLWARIRREGMLPLEQALSWTDQILEALQAAHALDMVHRDVKPSNVFVSLGEEREVIKLMDFGLARGRSGAELERLTRTGVMVGTPAYMSPELALGRTVDHRTDIYATGVVLYEMLTGRPPFQAPTLLEILHLHVHSRPPRVTEVRPALPCSAEVQSLLDRWMAKVPDARPPTAQQARQELGELLGLLGRRRGRTRKFDDTALMDSPPAPRIPGGAKPERVVVKVEDALAPTVADGRRRARVRRTGLPSQEVATAAAEPDPAEHAAARSRGGGGDGKGHRR